MAETLLEVVDLTVDFQTARGRLRAVDGVSFTLRAGETLALVGESGSGKTATALALLRLLPEPPGCVTAGRVLLGGHDVLELDPDELPAVRGREMAMIFQEPGGALNPVMTVGAQVVEAVRAHRTADRAETRRRTREALVQAGVASPERLLGQYPHELSGGLKQRVMIAMALACEPAVLIADEPTTALDVTVQARLLDLLTYLSHRLGLALLLITHDLGVVARTADRVAVMYAGSIVESAPVAVFFRRPAHPYSRGLLQACRLEERRGRLQVIEGTVADLLDLPRGCRFAPRCPELRTADARRPARPRSASECEVRCPPPVEIGPGHGVRCWLARAGGKAWTS